MCQLKVRNGQIHVYCTNMYEKSIRIKTVKFSLYCSCKRTSPDCISFKKIVHSIFSFL